MIKFSKMKMNKKNNSQETKTMKLKNSEVGRRERKEMKLMVLQKRKNSFKYSLRRKVSNSW